MKKWNTISEYNSNKSLVDQILDLRGIKDPLEKNRFLKHYSLLEIINEFDETFVNSLNAAKVLINDFIKENKQILVYGDYDSDGICATAILYMCIKNELKYSKIDYFIPNRFNHGYGFSKGGIEEVFKKFSDEQEILFITVDTGITAIEEVNYIKKLGHKVIITDHHQKPDNPPEPTVLVWSDSVVGSGVSWLLSLELGSKNLQSVSLAAIATVTDLQKILGVNRVIVKEGLDVLNTNPPLGIKKLIEVAGKQGSEISTYDLGWVIGPRLNASGRLEEATISLELVMSENEDKAFELAKKLNEVNTERQLKTVEMYEFAQLDSSKQLPKIILTSHENFHEGIIGLVAAKLVQKYYRPVIVVSLHDGIGKGSVRSIKGVNIIELLREVDDLFISLGGHPMAAGFTIEQDKLTVFEEKLNILAEKYISDELLVPELTIDIKMPAEKIGVALLNDMEALKPFGLGNEEPVFSCEKLGVVDVSWIGKDTNHLKLKLKSNNTYLKAVYFNADKEINLKLGDYIDVAFNLRKNEYNGNVSADLIVKDLKLSL